MFGKYANLNTPLSAGLIVKHKKLFDAFRTRMDCRWSTETTYVLNSKENPIFVLLSCSLPPPPSPPGVIAAHRITASAPDTDLPTVSSLRVTFLSA